MILEEGSNGYELWESSPNSFYFKLYYFNVTNSEDITARKPGLQSTSVDTKFLAKLFHVKEV
jgi:hypothetical protein